jgi:hypothetical protein
MQSSHRQKCTVGLRRMPAGLMIGSVCIRDARLQNGTDGVRVDDDGEL